MTRALPTKDQLRLITSEPDLVEIRTTIEREIQRVETDLDFRVDPYDQVKWESRARKVLAGLRYKARLVDQQLARVRPKTSSERPRELCHRLTLQVLDGDPIPRLSATCDAGAIEVAIARLDELIEAVSTDRTEEIGMPAAERDESFLARTNAALKTLRSARFGFQTRQREIAREGRTRRRVEGERTREGLFVDAAREILDRPTFLAIWDRVDHIQAGARPSEAA